MSRKVGFTPQKYQNEILKSLKKQPFMSTNEAAIHLRIGYDTSLKYLKELLKKRKIRLKKVGNRRFWYI